MQKNKRSDIPCIFYQYIHKRIYERAKGNNMKVSELISYLQEWRIPKQLRYLIIKELEMLGFITLNGRRRTEIHTPKFKEEDINYYYKDMGIF